ncbi:MAG: radical SAM protein [Anaerolineales bacterium]|nr:radical SAM protein [Anaerolineales bacterium]
MKNEQDKDLDKKLPDVMPAPRKVVIAITGRCNLKCRYCFYADEMRALEDLSTDRWLYFFKELGRLAVHRVTLTGGEVFSRPDLFELIDGIIDNRMRYSLLTNGTLITPNILDQFRHGKRLLRMDLVQVSLDGSRAEIHNLSRPDSFDRTLRGLQLLIEAGFPVMVRVTINRYNVDDLPEIARLLLEELDLDEFSINEAFPMGSAKCDGEGLMLTRHDRQKAMDILMALDRKYEGRIDAQAGPLVMAKELADIQRLMAKGETSKPGRGYLSACGGVFSKLDVQHDGTIVPCQLLPELTMGKIVEVNFQDVWLHHPEINRVRKRSLIPIRSLESCKDCPYAGFCTAGCPGTVMAQTGELDSRDPTVCYRIHLEGSAT